MRSRCLLWLILGWAQYLWSDCLSDTSTFQTIIEEATCNSQYVLVGHVVQDLPDSRNYANLPSSHHEKNHHEYFFRIDTILKGVLQGDISVFCGSTATICYKFETSKWPYYSLIKDSTYILFVKQDSIASNKLKKRIFKFAYAFPYGNILGIMPICKSVMGANCANVRRRTYDPLVAETVKKILNRDNKKYTTKGKKNGQCP